MDHPHSTKRRGGDSDDEYNEDPCKRIEMAVYELGNQSKQGSIAEEIDQVAQLIMKTGSSCPDAVVSSIVACILELPNKTDLMATLLGILNVGGKKDIVMLCLERLDSHLKDMKWWHLVQVPRIIVELTNVNVFSVGYLKTFLNSSVAIINGSLNGELLSTAILLSLPWISTRVRSEMGDLDKIIEIIAAYANSSDRYSCHFNEYDMKVMELDHKSDFLLSVLTAVKSDNFNFPGKTEPYKTFEGSLETGTVCDEVVLNFTSEEIKSVSSFEPFKPLKLFPDAFDNEASFLVVYYQFMLNMLIEAYELNHRRAAEVLFSSLPESCVDNPEKVICQVLFGKLVRAAGEPSKITYYEILLIDCCRLSKLFPPMMARSLMKLVAKMENGSTDLSLVIRLSTWFAHHLSHYDFKWNWAEWRSIVEAEELSVKEIFLKELLHNLLLLSYHEKMQSILPDYMITLLPSTSSAATPSGSFNKELLEFMKKRPSIDEVQTHLTSENIPLIAAFEVFLQLGSKTFSHLLNAMERYSALFKSSNESNQLQFMTCVMNFWSGNIQNFHIVMEKLVHYEVLNAENVVNFLFVKANEIFENFESEEFLNGVILKFFDADFFMVLIGKISNEEERVNFARSIIDRLAQIQQSHPEQAWLNWISVGLTRYIINNYFLRGNGQEIPKIQALLSLANAGYSNEIGTMLTQVALAISY